MATIEAMLEEARRTGYMVARNNERARRALWQWDRECEGVRPMITVRPRRAYARVEMDMIGLPANLSEAGVAAVRAAIERRAGDMVQGSTYSWGRVLSWASAVRNDEWTAMHRGFPRRAEKA